MTDRSDIISAATVDSGYFSSVSTSVMRELSVIPPVSSPILDLLPAVYDHERAVYLASVADASHRYTDMIAIMTRVVQNCTTPLLAHERTMVSVAFKAKLTSARSALKMLGMVAEHERKATHLAAVQAYARVMEANVLALTTEVVELANSFQLPVCEDLLARLDALPSSASSTSVAEKANVVEALVFWYKLCADYCRYVAECHTYAGVVASHSDMALRFYSKARQYAGSYLSPASATLLGVVLNLTVFLFEVRRCEEDAQDIARITIEEAIAAQSAPTDSSLPSMGFPVTPEAKRDTDAVLRLIRENMRVWGAAIASPTPTR